MDQAKDKIKQAWNDNPLMVIAIGAFAATAAAKLLDSMTRARSVRTWDREVARRERMSR